MKTPKLCQNCSKFHNVTIDQGCHICMKFQFREKILCELLRGEEFDESFKCVAYKPKLMLVNSDPQPSPALEVQIDSPDRDKWLRSYLVQQQKQNPEQVQSKLQYHLVFVTQNRDPLFSDNHFGPFSNVIVETIEQFTDTYIEVLWLAADHVHLYLSSSPDYSVDEIAQIIMRESSENVSKEILKIKTEHLPLWSQTYFVETMG